MIVTGAKWHFTNVDGSDARQCPGPGCSDCSVRESSPTVLTVSDIDRRKGRLTFNVSHNDSPTQTNYSTIAAVPSTATLKKYGLTADEWKTIYWRQGGVCAVCKRLPSTGRLNVDHAHVKGWKKLPPAERKKWVRGLVCYVCNHRILTRGVTADKLQSAADYLRAFAGAA